MGGQLQLINMTTEKGVNKSEIGEWVVVYDNVNVVQFDHLTDGICETMKDMFTANNEQDCLNFIEENNLIIDDD